MHLHRQGAVVLEGDQRGAQGVEPAHEHVSVGAHLVVILLCRIHDAAACVALDPRRKWGEYDHSHDSLGAHLQFVLDPLQSGVVSGECGLRPGRHQRRERHEEEQHPHRRQEISRILLVLHLSDLHGWNGGLVRRPGGAEQSGANLPGRASIGVVDGSNAGGHCDSEHLLLRLQVLSPRKHRSVSIV